MSNALKVEESINRFMVMPCNLFMCGLGSIRSDQNEDMVLKVNFSETITTIKILTATLLYTKNLKLIAGADISMLLHNPAIVNNLYRIINEPVNRKYWDTDKAWWGMSNGC